MPALIGYVDNTGSEGYAHWQMLLTLHHFAGGYGTLAAPVFTGSGSGTLTALDTHPATVTETWTIQCTGAPSAGSEVWSVTGSVSGAKANATTGVAYDNGLIAFTVTAGATAFAVGDTCTVVATQGALSAMGRAWSILRYVNPNDITQNRELILQGSGFSGSEQIFIGLRSYQSVSADYYNLTVAAFTGYVEANTFTAQPGYVEYGVCAHNLRIDYWLSVNAQRILFGLKIGSPSVYEIAYTGKYFPYAMPGQYPYPIACIGTLPGAQATRYSDTSTHHGTGARGGADSGTNGVLRNVMGSWTNYACLPWSADINNSSTMQRDTGGYYTAQKAVLFTGAGGVPNVSGNVWGELDGIRYLCGFNNTSENTATIHGTLNVVLGDAFRNGIGDYFLLEMS